MIGFLESAIRTLSFWLDSVIYGFIPSVYNLLIQIAETTVFSKDTIELFADRIYSLLGIFMLFKVSFSILTYIVNPDEFNDKNKGMSKMIKNILITLALLVATPWVFDQAMNLQRLILRDNVLGKIVLGSNGNSSSNLSSDANPGSSMAYEALRAFYHPDYMLHKECEEYVMGSDDVASASQACVNAAFKNPSDEYVNLLKYSATAKSVSIYLDWDLTMAKDNEGNFSMEYLPIFSTISGAVIVLVLISFCIDVAVRSIKLGFMQMIAPVPIISRIDPKKGTEVFNKWVKNCLSTYLDLFIRLLAIYFAIFVITQVLNTGMVNAVTKEPTQANFFVNVFIILGALMFAKQLPKLVEDLLGIKLSGTFNINPIKKLSEIPLAGSLAAGVAGGIDSKVHGRKFGTGFKTGAKMIPMTGGDGKKNFLEARKYAIQANKEKLEGKERQELLNEQIEMGKKYTGDNMTKEKIYKPEYLKSMNNVDDAKGAMYAWQNRATQAQSDYQAVVSNINSSQEERDRAYETLEKANEYSGKAKGQYEYRKSLHDALKKQMPDQAKIEDAIEAHEKMGGKTIPDAKTFNINPSASNPATPTSQNPVNNSTSQNNNQNK